VTSLDAGRAAFQDAARKSLFFPENTGTCSEFARFPHKLAWAQFSRRAVF
jgi:hypothetical protein